MKVLVVKLSSLGDLFHALPAVHSVREGLGAEIHWVVNAEYADLARCFSDVSRVIPFPRRTMSRDWLSFLRGLRAERYDLVLDLQGLLKSAFVAFAARGRRRIGPSFAREGTRLLYRELAGKKDRDRHVVAEILDVATYLHLAPAAPAFPLEFPAYASDLPRPRIALAPMSRWPSKNWPAPCYADAARRIRAVKGGSVCITGGPADRPVCAAIESAVGKPAANVAGQLSLVQLGGLLREMDLVIGNDSGPVHMAAAVGTPTLAIFGPTDPARTGPYGPSHRSATTSLPCRPCFSRSCHREGIPCLQGITPEHVAEIALEMLSRPRR
jgi:lipopolysaccharide heptosyltransferase I